MLIELRIEQYVIWASVLKQVAVVNGRNIPDFGPSG